jgi:hypothetical protein
MFSFSMPSLASFRGAPIGEEGGIVFCAPLWHAHKAAIARPMIRNNFIVLLLQARYPRGSWPNENKISDGYRAPTAVELF